MRLYGGAVDALGRQRRWQLALSLLWRMEEEWGVANGVGLAEFEGDPFPKKKEKRGRHWGKLQCCLPILSRDPDPNLSSGAKAGALLFLRVSGGLIHSRFSFRVDFRGGFSCASCLKVAPAHESVRGTLCSKPQVTRLNAFCSLSAGHSSFVCSKGCCITPWGYTLGE